MDQRTAQRQPAPRLRTNLDTDFLKLIAILSMLLDQLPLKVISIARPAWERSIYMVSDERIYLSPVVRNFQRFVLEQQGGETETVQKC